MCVYISTCCACGGDDGLYPGLMMFIGSKQTAEQHQKSDPGAPWRLVISTKINGHEGHFVCISSQCGGREAAFRGLPLHNLGSFPRSSSPSLCEVEPILASLTYR